MGQPGAKQGDTITATDNHMVIVPGSGTMLLPHTFNGTITNNLSRNVNIMGCPAATVDSTADNIPPHIPSPPGTMFQTPPANRATITTGSSTVRINGKPAARNQDTALTCNDPVDLPVGTVVATGTVMIG
jgi:uncharacterized Zn-binding protein involved in type VI secretion